MGRLHLPQEQEEATLNVELITHHGSDLLVVNAARASFGKEKEEFDEKDAKLIAFLARERHLLPFRHPQITLRLKVPIFVARQLGKHQTGMSWSEESRRYVDSAPEFFWPDKWRKRAANIKQGSSDEEVTDINGASYTVDQAARWAANHALSCYNDMLANGVAPELARMILPQNMYTTFVWTGSLLSFIHVIKERTNSHTQLETRNVAYKIKEILESLFPVSTAALLDV